MGPARAGKPVGAARGRARVLLAALALWPLAAATHAVPAPQYWPPLERPPLDPPLRLSATFGEYRIGHFHAGLDFSTGETIGRVVYASLSGHVVRVRASGIGYGRSLYVQAADGRLLVYGHLDAFAEPLASFVDSVQAATGQYEQDLWPEAGRFGVRAGQRLGWSGRSGTDSPHLHFEIRRGDMAYNPLLAGVSVEDTVPPLIRSVTLYPRSPESRVDGGVAPITRRAGGAADTFALRGGAGLLVEALDARASGERSMAPWRVRATEGGDWEECRFDSVSWAEGMSEVDYVYDRGLRAPAAPKSVLVWPAEGVLSRVQREGPAGAFRREVGSVPISGSASAETRRIQVEAEDVAGNRAEARVSILPVPMEAGPVAREDSAYLAALDPTWPEASRRRLAASPWRGDRDSSRVRLGRFTWNWTGGGFGEEPVVRGVLRERPRRSGELSGASEVLSLHPVLLPLRSPFRLAVDEPRADERLALYRDTGDGWTWIGADHDSTTRTLSAETRSFGRFALFRDAVAPRIEPLTPPRAVAEGPYPRWALEARLAEKGSGVLARESYFVVDGRRVPSEWDAVAETLRWRPLRTPASGRHEYEVVATDRAGNQRRRRGSFVLD